MIPADLTVFIRENSITKRKEAMLGWDKKSDEKAELWAKQEAYDYQQRQRVSHPFEKQTIGNDGFSKFQIISLDHDRKSQWYTIKLDGKDWEINVEASMIQNLIILNGVQPGGTVEGNLQWVIQKRPTIMDKNSQAYQDMMAMMGQKGFRDTFLMTSLIPGTVYYSDEAKRDGHLFLGIVNHLVHTRRNGQRVYRIGKEFAFLRIYGLMNDRDAFIKDLKNDKINRYLDLCSTKTLRAVGFSICPDMTPEELLLQFKKNSIKDGMETAEREETDYNQRITDKWGRSTYATVKIGNRWLERYFERAIMSNGLPIRVPVDVKPAMEELEKRAGSSWSSAIKNNIIFTSDLEL